MEKILDFKTHRCSDGDIDAVVDFSARMRKEHAITFLPTQRSEFLGKYRAYATGDERDMLNFFVVRNKRNDIVGCTGYIPFYGLLGKKKIHGLMGADAVIDPVYGAKFPTLAFFLAACYEKLIRKDKMFSLVSPAGVAVSQSFRKVQWGQFAHIYKLASDGASGMLPDMKSSRMIIKRIERFGEKFGIFFERILEQHHFLLNTDVGFLNWKYFSNPYAQYVVLEATIDDDIIGYIVVEQRDSDIYVIDLTVDLHYPRAIVLLLFQSFTYLKRNRISPTIFHASHARYIEILKRVGFISCIKYECLFFKVSLLMSSLTYEDLDSTDKQLYHFNGFTPHLY